MVTFQGIFLKKKCTGLSYSISPRSQYEAQGPSLILRVVENHDPSLTTWNSTSTAGQLLMLMN